MRIALNNALKRQGVALSLICVLSVVLGFSLALNVMHHADTPVVAAAGKPDIPSDWRTAFEDVAGKLGPSVVYIESEKMVEVKSMFPGMEDFFSFGPFGGPKHQAPEQQQKQMTKASGSGVIIRSDGYILTNNHVVSGADRVIVRLRDGREFKGKVMLDPRTDLALVKIDANNLPAAQLADSDEVKVGQWSVAIGNPFGLRNTVTVGVVSAIRKETDKETDAMSLDAIQTDAPINPGNSGGPLVDLSGRVIGINRAIYSPSGGSVGIGFAIPSNTAKYVMGQLIEKGKVVRGYLGLRPVDVPQTLKAKFGADTGALVDSVDEGSPAAEGGIKQKDVIIKINEKPVSNAVELRNIIQKIAPGTSVKLVVIRDKKENTITVKLGEAPGIPGETGDEEIGDKTGLSVQPLSPDTAKELGIDASVKGVVVQKVEAGSPADRAGIQRGDVITEIDDAPITSVAGFTKAVSKLKSGETAVIVIQRGDSSTIIPLPID